MKENKVSKLFVFEIVLGVLWLITLGVDIIDTLFSSVVGALLIGFPTTKASWCEEGDTSEECQNGPVPFFLLAQLLFGIPVVVHTLLGIAVSSFQFRKMPFIITKLVLQGVTVVLSLILYIVALVIAFLVNSPDHPLGPATQISFIIWGVVIGVVLIVLKVPSICLCVAMLVLSKFVIAEDRREAALRKSQGSDSNNMEDEEEEQELEDHDIEMHPKKGRDRADSNASNPDEEEGDEKQEEDRSHRRDPPDVPNNGAANGEEESDEQQQQEQQAQPIADDEEDDDEGDADDAQARYEEMRRQASMHD